MFTKFLIYIEAALDRIEAALDRIDIEAALDRIRATSRQIEKCSKTLKTG
jgi:hypothetical protein